VLLPWSKSTTIALGANGIAIKTHDATPKSLVKLDSCYQNINDLTSSLMDVVDQIDATSVNFLISNHFVRYIVLPWQAGVVSRKEWIALAEHAFRESYGHVAEQWEVRVSLTRYGEQVVACALDQALIDSLHAVAVDNRWHINIIEPLFMTVLQNIRLENEHAWLLLGEPERVLLAEYQDGEWRGFSMINPPVGKEFEQSQQLLIRQLTQTQGSGRPKQILACMAPQLKGDLHIDGIRVQSLRIGDVNKTSNCALWMAGL